MKTKNEVMTMFGYENIISRAIDSIFETSKTTDFKSLLDFSYNNNIMVSSDYGGEDQSSDYKVYTATFSTFKSTENWLNQVSDEFNLLGYKGEPQYKDIKATSLNGKFLDFIEIANKHFKGFVVSFLIPKEITSCFSGDIQKNHDFVKKISGISDFKLSPKNTEKALRIGTLISMVLFFILEKDSNYFWLTDKDSIAKMTSTENMFEQSMELQKNMVYNLLDEDFTPKIGYSLPDKDNDCFQSYYFITLNDLFSGSLADVFSSEHPKDKSAVILKESKNIPKFFYEIKKENKGYSASRVIIKIQ